MEKTGRVFADRVRPLCFLGLCLEVGEVTCVPLPLVMLVREFPFPSTCVFPLRVSALFPVAADPKDPLPSYVGVPAPTQPKSGKGHAMQGPFLLPVLSEGETLKTREVCHRNPVVSGPSSIFPEKRGHGFAFEDSQGLVEVAS